MDKAINKFIVYLNMLAKEIKDEAFALMFSKDINKESKLHALDLRDREVSNFIKYFTVKREYDDNHGEVFADYQILCSYLDSSFLNNKEKYYIILYFIEKNVKSGILVSDTLLVDLKDLESKGVEPIVAKFIRNLILNNELQSFMTRDVSELTEGEQIIYDTIKKFSIDLTPYKNTISLFKEHLTDKMDTYNEYDIDVIESTLIDVGVSESCLSAFLYVLKKDLDKRVVEDKTVSTVSRCEVKRDPNLLTDKEYKALKKRVRSIWDHYNRVLLQDVTYDEMLELGYIMVRIGYEQYDIENFFRAVTKSIEVDYTNVIGEFVSNFDKYSYYLDEDTINEILEYMGEMFICDDETYIFWKNEVGRILRYNAHKFNNKVDYELSLVKKSK